MVETHTQLADTGCRSDQVFRHRFLDRPLCVQVTRPLLHPLQCCLARVMEAEDFTPYELRCSLAAFANFGPGRCNGLAGTVDVVQASAAHRLVLLLDGRTSENIRPNRAEEVDSQ